MIYASIDDTHSTPVTIVAGADSIFEFEAFHTNVTRPSATALFDRFEQPSAGEMMLDDRFAALRATPLVFEHATAAQRLLFANQHAITLVPIHVLASQQRKMLEAAKGPSLEADPWYTDSKPISELLGLNDNDPWDKRTDEQKQNDEEMEKRAKKLRKEGKLTGDSFSPGAGKTDAPTDDATSGVQVKRVDLTRNRDGSITIDGALAVSGDFYDNNQASLQDGCAPETTSTVPPVDAARGPTQPAVHRLIVSPQSAPGTLGRWFEVLDILPPGSSASDYATIVMQEGSLSETGPLGAPVLFSFFDLRSDAIAINRLAAFLSGEGVDYRVQILDEYGQPSLRTWSPDAALAAAIMPDSMVAIYHRLDLPERAGGHRLETVLEVLEADFVKRSLAARGQNGDVVWLACATKLASEQVHAKLIADSRFTALDIEVYGVNDMGERLIPRGEGEIVEDDGRDKHPRPWNTRLAEWAALDEAGRATNLKTLQGSEFIFTGDYQGPGRGTVVWIQPRAYFRDHDALWEQSLKLGDLLPEDLKEIRPGVYRSTARDYIHINNALSSSGFQESLGLQLFLNML